MLKVVAIIPSFNRRRHLIDVLNDLSNQRTEGIELNVCVVIDGSVDGSVEEVTKFHPDVRKIQGDGSWYYTRCINEGVAAMRSFNPDLILTLNDDIRLKPNYVQHLLKGYASVGKKGVMGSLSVTCDESNRITFAGITDIKWWRMKWVNRIEPMTELKPGELSGVGPSKVLPGRGMLIDRALFDELNGFDERLPQYGSDDDFCLRAQKKGYPVNICFDAIVHSHHKMTGVGNRVHRNRVKDILKAFTNRYSTLYLPKTALMIIRHGNRLLLPFTILTVITASLLTTVRSR